VCVRIQVKWQQNNASVFEVDTYDYDNVNDKCHFCPNSQVTSSVISVLSVSWLLFKPDRFPCPSTLLTRMTSLRLSPEQIPRL